MTSFAKSIHSINQTLLNNLNLPKSMTKSKLEYYKAGVVAYAQALNAYVNGMVIETYQVSFVPAIGGGIKPFTSVTNSLESAKEILKNISNYTLVLHDRGLMHDHSNYGYIETLVDGSWVMLDEEVE